MTLRRPLLQNGCKRTHGQPQHGLKNGQRTSLELRRKCSDPRSRDLRGRHCRSGHSRHPGDQLRSSPGMCGGVAACTTFLFAAVGFCVEASRALETRRPQTQAISSRCSTLNRCAASRAQMLVKNFRDMTWEQKKELGKRVLGWSAFAFGGLVVFRVFTGARSPLLLLDANSLMLICQIPHRFW